MFDTKQSTRVSVNRSIVAVLVRLFKHILHLHKHFGFT